jgi:ketosteroid isomerase-like protein
MSKENVEAVRAVFKEWGQGNLRAGGDLFDPDILLITAADLPDAGRFLGRDSVQGFMRGFLEAWSNLTITAGGTDRVGRHRGRDGRSAGRGKGKRRSGGSAVLPGTFGAER